MLGWTGNTISIWYMRERGPCALLKGTQWETGRFRHSVVSISNTKGHFLSNHKTEEGYMTGPRQPAEPEQGQKNPTGFSWKMQIAKSYPQSLQFGRSGWGLGICLFNKIQSFLWWWTADCALRNTWPYQ